MAPLSACKGHPINYRDEDNDDDDDDEICMRWKNLGIRGPKIIRIR